MPASPEVAMFHALRGRRASRIAVLVLGAACAGGPAAAQLAPLWTAKPAGRISGMRVMGPRLLVLTDSALVAFDATDGCITWARTDLAGLQSRYVDAFRNALALLVRSRQGLERLELLTGRTQWEIPIRDSLPLLAYYVASTRDLLLTMHSNRGTGRVTVIGWDLATGAARWRQDSTFNRAPELFALAGETEEPTSVTEMMRPPESRAPKVPTLFGHQLPLLDSDTSLVLYMSADGPVKLDTRTGAVLWRSAGLEAYAVPTRRSGSPHLVASGSRLLVLLGRRVAAIDTRTGALLWITPREMPADIVQRDLIPEGLLVRSGSPARVRALEGKGHALEVVDTATGAWRWNEPFRVPNRDLTPFSVGEDRVFVAAGAVVHAVRPRDGTARRFAKPALKGRDIPWRVEAQDNGVLVRSRQNVVLLDSTGAPVYQVFHESPYSILRAPYGFVLMLTNEADSAGRRVSTVVQVDKRTGRERWRLALPQKESFLVDGTGTRVFLRRGDNTVAAFGAPPHAVSSRSPAASAAADRAP